MGYIKRRELKRGHVWDAQYRAKVKGKWVKVKKTFRLKSEAEDWLAERRPEARAGTYRKPTAATVSEYLDIWTGKELPLLKPGARRSYSSLINKWIGPTLGDFTMAAVGPVEAGLLRSAMMGAGLSARSVRNGLNLLGKIFKTAMADGYATANPAAGVQRPKPRGRKIRALKPDELRDVLKALEGKPARLMVLMSFLTGLRQGELFGLQWGDVDFKKNIVRVRRSLDWNWGTPGDKWSLREPKTSKSDRSVDMAPGLKTELRALWLSKGKPAKGFVFSTKAGGPLVPQNVYRRHLKPLLDKLDTSDGRVNWHSLRHSYASALIDAGVDVLFVSLSLGHSSISITADVYGHLLTARRPEAGAALEKIALGTPAP